MTEEAYHKESMISLGWTPSEEGFHNGEDTLEKPSERNNWYWVERLKKHDGKKRNFNTLTQFIGVTKQEAVHG